MKVDLARGHAHGARGEHQVEDPIGLEMIEQKPQQSLHSELGVAGGKPTAGIFALAFEEFSHGVAGGETMLECGVDAAGGDRRDHAGGVAD